MNIRKRISSALFLAAATCSWQAGAEAQTMVAQTMVVVGDSLSAGYLNSSLHQNQQPRGYASVVAGQAGIDLPLPLIAAPGIPSVLMLNLETGEITRAPGSSMGRVDPTVQTYNLAVPGATAHHALALKPNFGAPITRVQGLTNLVLGLPGAVTGDLNSQVEWAQELDPDIVLLWVGGQDALLGLINGTDAAATDANKFEDHFVDIMDALQGTGAKVIVANVPNVSTIPYLLSRGDAATFLGIPEAFLGALVADDEFVTLDALGPIGAALLGDPSEFFDRSPETCFVVATANVADADPDVTCDDYILTAEEVAMIETKVAAYNTVINNVETDYPGVATLVDMHGFFAAIAPFIAVNGPPLTVDFLGGIFSLDGIHPTFTGQALVADEFIAAINAAYQYEAIPPLSNRQILAVRKSDPLASLFAAKPPPALAPVFDLGAGNTVSGVLGPRALEPR